MILGALTDFVEECKADFRGDYFNQEPTYLLIPDWYNQQFGVTNDMVQTIEDVTGLKVGVMNEQLAAEHCITRDNAYFHFVIANVSNASLYHILFHHGIRMRQIPYDVSVLFHERKDES